MQVHDDVYACTCTCIYINFKREGWEIDALWLARPLLLVVWCSHVVHLYVHVPLSRVNCCHCT